MSVDPLADQFSGWSPYNYTLNNPINMIDPDGRAPDWIRDEDSNGTVTYTAEDGDSALSLFTQFGEQDGFTAEQANEMVEACFGSNYCTPEGQLNSNVDPGNVLAIYSEPTPEHTLTEEPSSQVPNFGIIGDITGVNQLMRDMDHALDVYEAEGLMPYLYTQIDIAHKENASSMGRAFRNRLGRTRSRSATGSARTTNTRTTSSTVPAVRVSGQNKPIHTGPRGGKYYINSNGNKTYLNRDGTKRKT